MLFLISQLRCEFFLQGFNGPVNFLLPHTQMKCAVSHSRSAVPFIQPIEDAKQRPKAPANAGPPKPVKDEIPVKEEIEEPKPEDPPKETEEEETEAVKRTKMQMGCTVPLAGFYGKFRNDH